MNDRFVAGTVAGVVPRRSRRSLRIQFHIVLLSLDMFSLLAAIFGAYWLHPVSSKQVTLMIMTVLPVYSMMAIAMRAYSVSVTSDILGGVVRSLHGLVISAAAVLFAAFILKLSGEFSRIIFGLTFVLAAVLLTVTRFIFLLRARAFLGGNPYNVGLITDGSRSFAVEEYSVVLHAARFDPASDSPHMYHSLAIALRNLDRVVLDCRPEHRQIWSHALQGANVSAEIIAPELLEIAPQGIGRFSDLPTIVVARGPLGLFDRAGKRGFDIAVALCAIIALAPVLVVIALAIRFETAGPIFFLQDRIGRSNRIFKVWKFRSMRVGA